MVDTPLNSTISGMNAISSIDSGFILWFVGIATAIIIILSLWTVFTKFRYFVTGAMVTTATVILYKISQSVGSEASTGNWIPFKMLGYVAGFIILSTLFGFVIIRFTKIGKKIDGFMNDSKEILGEDKRKRKK